MAQDFFLQSCSSQETNNFLAFLVLKNPIIAGNVIPNLIHLTLLRLGLNRTGKNFLPADASIVYPNEKKGILPKLLNNSEEKYTVGFQSYFSWTLYLYMYNYES